ncbi:pyruvate kinase [Apiospora aurea]|uniref:pyruvate kinase n=1 Tax=Apiospora aurea TaxID=335848 RepID=A0ABR1QP79_9PEZI
MAILGEHRPRPPLGRQQDRVARLHRYCAPAREEPPPYFHHLHNRPQDQLPEAINKLRTAGLNVVRMNFSHGSYEYHQSVIDNARAAEKSQKGRQVAIALDTKGPEIRTGNTANDEDLPWLPAPF